MLRKTVVIVAIFVFFAACTAKQHRKPSGAWDEFVGDMRAIPGGIMTLGEAGRRYWATDACVSGLPPVADPQAALAALRESNVRRRASTLGANWSYLGYNMSMHDSCEQYPGGSEALGRAYVRAMRKAVECMNAIGTPARRRDAARFLSFFQPGGVPIANGDRRGPPLRFWCPDRATAAREFAEAYAPLRTEGCMDPSFPTISVVRDSRMVIEGNEAERERKITAGLAHETAHLLGYNHDGSTINLPFLIEACCFLPEPEQVACDMLRRAARPGSIRTGREMAAAYRAVNRTFYGFYEFWPKRQMSGAGLMGYALAVGQLFGPPMLPVGSQSRRRDNRPAAPRRLDAMMYVSAAFVEGAFQAFNQNGGLTERLRVSLETEYERTIRNVVAPLTDPDAPNLRRYLVLWGALIEGWGRGDHAAIESALAGINQLREPVCAALAARTDVDALNASWGLVMRTMSDEESILGPQGRSLGEAMSRWDSISQFCISQSTSR